MLLGTTGQGQSLTSFFFSVTRLIPFVNIHIAIYWPYTNLLSKAEKIITKQKDLHTRFMIVHQYVN